MIKEKSKNEEISRFEAVIDLLFGDQIKKYDTLIEQMSKHIKKLEKQIDENKKDYNNKILQLSAEIAGNIANLDENISRKIKTDNTSNIKKINELNKQKIDKKVLAEKLALLVDAVSN